MQVWFMLVQCNHNKPQTTKFTAMCMLSEHDMQSKFIPEDNWSYDVDASLPTHHTTKGYVDKAHPRS
jgi:hypothetical protein